MSDKTFKYLVVLTISLFVLALISYLIQPKYETLLKKGEFIFGNIKNKINDVNEIQIDNGINKIVIIKDQDNWFMKSKYDYKVRNDLVRKNLIQITELAFYEKKTSNEFLYSRLDLDYPNNEEGLSKSLKLISEDNVTLAEFILGKKKKYGVYIKKIDEKETWLTSGLLEMSSNDQDWLVTQITNIDYKNLKSISLTHESNNSFSISKDDKNENFIINNINKDQLPKSDLIANFLGHFLENLNFENVVQRKEPLNNKFITKINFQLFNLIDIKAMVFEDEENKWVNFDIDDNSLTTLKNDKQVLVKNIKDWSYKLARTKYNILDTKLKDLLVED